MLVLASWILALVRDTPLMPRTWSDYLVLLFVAVAILFAFAHYLSLRRHLRDSQAVLRQFVPDPDSAESRTLEGLSLHLIDAAVHYKHTIEPELTPFEARQALILASCAFEADETPFDEPKGRTERLGTLLLRELRDSGLTEEEITRLVRRLESRLFVVPSPDGIDGP